MECKPQLPRSILQKSGESSVISLVVVIEYGMAGIVLVPVSQFGEDQLLWLVAWLHFKYQ